MKGLPRSHQRGAVGSMPIRKMSIPIRALPITVNGVTGIGFGSVSLGSLPQGNLLYLGAVAYLRFSTADAGVIAAFTGSYGLGTGVNADTALAGTDADLIPATTISAATAQVSPVVRGASTDALGGGVIDNTDTTLNINLNLLIDDASISAAAPFTVDGVVYVSLIVLGDD